MAREPWAYPWLSAGAYALGEADPLVTEDPYYTELSPHDSRRRELWREFLLGEDVREGAIRRGDWAIGAEDFRECMAEVLGRPLPRRLGRPRKGQVS